MTADHLMNTAEYAALWGCHPKTAARRAASGEWDALRSGDRWLFSTANHQENLRRAAAAAEETRTTAVEKGPSEPARRTRHTRVSAQAAAVRSNVRDFQPLQARTPGARRRTA